MSGSSNRVDCPQCGASNFTSSAVCWQCGRPLKSSRDDTPQEKQPDIPGQTAGPAINPPPFNNQPGGSPQIPGTEAPPPPYSTPTSSIPRSDTQTMVILGYIFGGLGFFCCIFTIVAWIFGYLITQKGDERGKTVSIVATVVLIAGIVIGRLVDFGISRRMPWKYSQNDNGAQTMPYEQDGRQQGGYAPDGYQ